MPKWLHIFHFQWQWIFWCLQFRTSEWRHFGIYRNKHTENQCRQSNDARCQQQCSLQLFFYRDCTRIFAPHIRADITFLATSISIVLPPSCGASTLTQMLFEVDKLKKFQREKNANTLALGKLWIGKHSAKRCQTLIWSWSIVCQLFTNGWLMFNFIPPKWFAFEFIALNK